VLFDCLENATAWEMLHDPQVAGVLDAEGMLLLCRAAGMGEDEAQKAASARAWERVRRDLPA
jgi:hypothetical protein